MILEPLKGLGQSEHLLVRAVLSVCAHTHTFFWRALSGDLRPRGGPSQAGRSAPAGQVLALPLGTRADGKREGCYAMWMFLFEMIGVWIYFALGSIYVKKLPVMYLISYNLFFFFF